MNTLKVIIQIGCLIMLCAIALILSHRPAITSATEPKADSSPIAKWDYSQFEFFGPLTDEFGKKLYAHLVFYDLNTETLGLNPVKTNRIIAIDQVLREIGNDGWQYLWCNGSNFIVRRPEGIGRHHYFSLEYTPQND